MRVRSKLTNALTGIVILIALTGVGCAAEVKVLSTHAALEVLNELGPEFERTTGNKLSFSYDPANVIKRQIENGATFDVVLITRSAIDDLTKQGKILPDTRVNIGRSGLGVADRKGAPKPDISNVDSFKQALLSAKSIIRSTEGNSGVYFERLMDRLGISDEMKGKVRLGPSGRVAEFVARGEVEVAVQQISELLPVAGTEFVGPFPQEVQLYTLFAVARRRGLEGTERGRSSRQFPCNTGGRRRNQNERARTSTQLGQLARIDAVYGVTLPANNGHFSSSVDPMEMVGCWC
jgi:molybdate transport system substrate-binding protein